MRQRTRFLVTLGLIVGILAAILIWRVTHEGDLPSISPLDAAPTRSMLPLQSPLAPPTPLPSYSPLPVPPTGTPPVSVATLEAIRTLHSTASQPSPSDIRWPHISPATWRRWALWIFAAAAVLAYAGLRLQRKQ